MEKSYSYIKMVALRKGDEKIQFIGLGTFETAHRAERTGKFAKKRSKRNIIQIGRELCIFTEEDIAYVKMSTTTIEQAERRLTTARQRCI
ncbi:HU family DNA-binding protein [Hespellia stercorisuis]|uniref:Uncharacterized protein n=1 Tax=Hespellia stercorisuis DSM 15480 TaxID=1121950 RepID=A0A1M6UM74_9FIRM|nr:hypothetical protein [Hespellia stercorisuis]SHK70297.1 hypothetical protein SAMN02745243_03544 [Hespellia stercorisuis DSM 15480]